MDIHHSVVRGVKNWIWLPFFHTGERSSSPGHYSPPPEALRRVRELLARILNENIIAFWYPGIVDLEDGGYRPPQSFQENGHTRSGKSLVAQARTVWFFSRLAKSAYRADGYLEAAKHGYEFLRDGLWDKDFGGFFWEVDSTGRTPTKPDKHLYGQAFGLYALTEYADASGDTSARALAQTLFDLLEAHTHDSLFGGYRESFSRDWSTIPSECQGYLGAPGNMKLMNTHLHLLEAMTRYYLTIPSTLAKQRLIELLFVSSNSVVRKDLGACTDRYLQGWEPLRGAKYDRVSYGHDVESIWLMAEACKTVGLSNHLLLDLYRTLFANALRYGFDRRRGGFYESGPVNAPADQRDKLYWVQAEALVGALQMYRFSAEKPYWSCFSRTLEWVHRYQADWQRGNWHVRVAADGTPRRTKPYAWGSPYHQGRAMLTCLEWLA